MTEETPDASDTSDAPDARDAEKQVPARDYADFDVDDFPGGLQGCLEAILMSAEDPLAVSDIARVVGVSETEITAELEAMRTDYAAQYRGFDLVRSVRGWRFMSRAEYEPVVAAFITDKQNNRLSQAALEALAIIAYKQPVTRAQVSSIRGVSSDGVIRSLMLRGLITEMGEESGNHARVLATSDLFLEKLGVNSLEELPALAPFLPEETEALQDSDEDSLDRETDVEDMSMNLNDTVITADTGAKPFNQFIDHAED